MCNFLKLEFYPLGVFKWSDFNIYIIYINKAIKYSALQLKITFFKRMATFMISGFFYVVREFYHASVDVFYRSLSWAIQKDEELFIFKS